MAFTSPTFLFLFLPLVLAAFFVSPRRARTPLLVVAGLFFYAWAEKHLVLLLVASTILNWGLALWIDRAVGRRSRHVSLGVAVALNIGALSYFKYANFFVATLDTLLVARGRPPIALASVHLPIAVSFVTFEALSYVVDVYRRDIRAARNPLHVAFYLSFFPHLVAGPILRFRDIAASLSRPAPTLAEFDSGVTRFIVGLAKKVLLASSLGQIADQVFKLPADQLTADTAWLGIVCYALQIYFDFSGYSDMAIGLGHLFGFTLPENFRLPYAAQSIREFWRRWHISLSSWFRDYLFVPLGGSRHGVVRTHVNLLIVFLLCGLWHGASWNFVVWGAYHGVFLVLERTAFGRLVEWLPRPLRHAYALLVVLIGWVFFRSETLGQALQYLSSMFFLSSGIGPSARSYFTTELQVVLGAGLLLSLVPWREWLSGLRSADHGMGRWISDLSLLPLQLALLFFSLLYVAAGTYQPFIYFRF